MNGNISGCRKPCHSEAECVVANVTAKDYEQEVSSWSSLALNNGISADELDESALLALESFHRRVESEAVGHFNPTAAVEGLLRGVLLVLSHHKFPQVLVQSFCDQARTYLVCDDEKTFVARAKFFLCVPMARYLDNELPPCPGVDFAWVGRVRRWVRSRMSVNASNTHLWWSFYQAKRACLPLSNDYVRYTYEKHRSQMAAPDPIDEETFNLVMSQLEPVLDELATGLDETYKVGGSLDGEAGVPLPERAHMASTSACYESTVKDGGQRGHLARVFAWDTTEKLGYTLRSVEWFPRVWIDGRLRFNACVSFYAVDDQIPFLRAVGQDDRRWFSTGAPVRMPCMIQGIIEPLKVRVISKGPAAPYYLAKGLQKALHTLMRRMNCFRLIGRPMSPTDLLDLDRNSVRLRMFEGRSWFSIDYSAATDGLSARLSAAILTRLLPRSMSGYEQSRCLSVLAPHRCEYPPKSGVDPIDQNNGQLMGSILSFPILCLANLGLYLAVIRNDTRPLKRKLDGVLVNGDDMLYVAAPSLYSEHMELGRRCGLELSVGKSYVHTTFASANSTCFHSHLDQKPRFNGPQPVEGVRQINFLNTGLFFGNSKVMRVDSIAGEDVRSMTRLDVLGALLSGCRTRSQERDLAKMYFARHRVEIQREAQGRNYFVHRSLGGCGAAVPFDWDWTTTARHRAIAFDQAFKRGGAGTQAGSLAGVSFKVFGPREAPSIPDLFSRDSAPWVAPEERLAFEPPRWPTVLCRRDGRATQYVPSNRCFTRVQLLAGIESTSTVREY